MVLCFAGWGYINLNVFHCRRVFGPKGYGQIPCIIMTHPCPLKFVTVLDECIGNFGTLH